MVAQGVLQEGLCPFYSLFLSTGRIFVPPHCLPYFRRAKKSKASASDDSDSDEENPSPNDEGEDEELERVKSDRFFIRKDRDAKADEIMALEGTITKLQQEVDFLLSQNQALHQDKCAMQERIDEQIALIDKIKSEHIAEIELHEADIASLKQKIADLESEEAVIAQLTKASIV